MESFTFDDSSVLADSFCSTLNATIQTDIGSHFVDLLKMSGCPEAILPNSEVINDFFAQDGGEEFGRFLSTIGPQNIVSDEEISCAESVTESEEIIDTYLSEKLGDQSEKVPVTQVFVDSLLNEWKKIESERTHLETFKTYIESEIKSSGERLSSLKESIASLKKENNDTLLTIKCSVDACEKISAECKQTMDDFFPKYKILISEKNNVLDDVSSMQAEIYIKLNTAAKQISEIMTSFDDNVKDFLLTVFLLPSVQCKVSQALSYKKFLQMVTDWFNIVNRWLFIHNLISSYTQLDSITNYMSHIIKSAKGSVNSVNAGLENLSLQEDSAHTMDLNFIKANVKKLNQVLSGSPSPSLETLSVSVKNFDRASISCKNELEKTIMDLDRALKIGLYNMDKTLNIINNETSKISKLEEIAKNVEQKFDDSIKISNEIAEMKQKKQSVMNELIILAITDQEQFLVKLTELENTVKLFEKAVL